MTARARGLAVASRPNPFGDLDSRAVGVEPGRVLRALGAEVRSLAHPRRPDRRLLASLESAARGPIPSARQTVQLTTIRQRPRRISGWLMFERLTGADEIALQSFIVVHPEATILIDPAIPRDVEQAMIDFPTSARGLARPPAPMIPTVEGLAELGVTPDLALVTHAHWDHVSGLLDLPDVPVVLPDLELDWVATGELAPAGGVRRGLARRPLHSFALDGPPILTFAASHDLFGDASIVAVPLPGHTPGSIGLLLATDDGPILLVGDAAWHSRQVEQVRQRSGIPGCLVDHDREQTWRTLHRLHALPPSITVVPAHDHALAARWVPGSDGRMPSASA